MSLLDKVKGSNKFQEIELGAMDEKDFLTICLIEILELRDDIKEIKDDIQQVKKNVNV